MIQPFYEGRVQQYVTAYLTAHGYSVRQEVTVRNGKVDILACRDDQELCVEVKGEDRGGYTSAEMNLQIGFGQLLSRMNQPNWRYGLAMPDTPDFRRVLLKYRSGFGIDRLGWTFFLASQSGQVRAYNAYAFQRFIDQLPFGVR